VTVAVPSMVRFIRQSGHHADCGVVCLSMLAGVMYEDALAAILPHEPAVLHRGIRWTELRRAAKVLGIKTKLLRAYDLEEDTGILGLKALKKGVDDHYTFLWEGRIVDGGKEGWRHPSDYCKHYALKPTWLLTAVE
jgi:ABC-type bacteriocin/lantibiotic exporter with double-glycine peptidase domain